MSFDQLLLPSESQALEYKASFDKATVELLVAFEYAKGGSVLAGVKDNGDVRGVTLGKETLNEWLGQTKSATSAPYSDIEIEEIKGKTVVVIRVTEFPVKPVNSRGRYLKREPVRTINLGCLKFPTGTFSHSSFLGMIT